MTKRALACCTVAVLCAHWGCGPDKSVPGETSTGSGEGSSRTSDDDSADEGKPDDEGKLDDEGAADGGETKPDENPEDRACHGCWYENKLGECAELLAACEDDLACSLLMTCPYDCAGEPDCVEQCNAIVPSGVEPLTALANCMNCGQGPCVDACAESHFAEYCE